MIQNNKSIYHPTPQPTDGGQIIFKLLFSSNISPKPQDGVGQITP